MGLDYGNGLTNIDLKTKIRYGIISLNSVLEAWAESSEPYYSCKTCEEAEETCEADCEPSSWFYDREGYHAHTCFDGTEIMITKSPYFTWGTYCSPCAPGAICLAVGDGKDDIAYCFGHDWFEDKRAPYRVFLVETGKEVLP